MTKETNETPVAEAAGRVWQLLVFMADHEGYRKDCTERAAGYMAGLVDALHIFTGEGQESIEGRLDRALARIAAGYSVSVRPAAGVTR